MLKFFHLGFVIMALVGFVARVLLSELAPMTLQRKAVKIAPHVIDTLLLVSGITLVFQGHWLAVRYDWLIAKLAGLFGYIGFGVVTMRHRGRNKWLAFAAALACFAYIGTVAVTKRPYFL